MGVHSYGRPEKQFSLFDHFLARLGDSDFQLILLGALVVLYIVRLVASWASGKGSRRSPSHNFIPDKYRSIEEVQVALRTAGLESSNLIIGIDYTKSNDWSGARSFGGKGLHDCSGATNPYQEAISVIGQTLEVFDDDRLIPVFGFGDAATSDRTVFSLIPHNEPAHGVKEALEKYREVTPLICLSGPTSFVPLIRRAIDIVKEEKAYHILLIIADGQVSNEKENIAAIVKASNYPLSIVMVGVGDGPWDTMNKFDDDLDRHGRKFDNFQFVDFTTLKRTYYSETDPAKFEAAFALAALQEIPEQFKYVKEAGLLG